MNVLYLINYAGKAGTEKYVENLVRILGRDQITPFFAYNIDGELSEKMREVLYEIITEKALAWAVMSVSPAEIDEINILNARMKTMDLAIRALKITPAYALIDGNQSRGISVPCETVLKGDSRVRSIAAASILAKVSRDRLMIDCDRLYPAYGFAKHKGYGTEAHYAALRRFGPCEIHRMSFLNKFFAAEAAKITAI